MNAIDTDDCVSVVDDFPPDVIRIPTKCSNNRVSKSARKKLFLSSPNFSLDTFPPGFETSEGSNVVSVGPKNLPCRMVFNTPFSSRSIISYGLVVYAQDTKRWAVVQRKHSIEFLLFIRGVYRPTYLPLLLSRITKQESEIILRCLEAGPRALRDVFINDLDLDASGLNYATIRMSECISYVRTLLSKTDFSNNTLAWTWPKGRPSYTGTRETPFACARREFTEEVEIQLPPPLFISDSYLSTNFRTFAGRVIESRFWIYVIPKEIPMPPIDFHPEVADRKWVDTDTCSGMIPDATLFSQITSIVESIDEC